ncbi:MAG: 4Fe-4S binding protein [Ignavibacteriales bacterium]|nr:4Fe-4S binding protein [Ignavibacteriales bacterium]
MKKRQKIRNSILLFSLILFPAIFFYLSPYLIIDATYHNIINGSFIFFIILLITALIFGRAYCGWVCPAAVCQEFISKIKDKKVVKWNWLKWVIWIPWIIIIIFSAINVGGYLKIDLFYPNDSWFQLTDEYIFYMYLFVIIIIILPGYIFGKRSFCHHICWMAPFMITGRKISNTVKFPSLRLVANPDNCIGCHNCTENCPMSLPVEEMVRENKMENSECVLCGTCVDDCKNNAIKFSFKARY